MIPKIIHYCWFGRGDKPQLAKKCIASWKKYCPDYEVIEWNEDNFDINLNGYTKWCYENKKYAFLSDYVRLWVVYHYGGFYFDTDVELIRNPDFLLKNEAFFGFETNGTEGSDKKNATSNTGLGFGSIETGSALKSMLKEYDSLLDGKHGVIGCPILNTKALVQCGLIKDGSYQELSSATVYPKEYFNPYDASTGRLNKTANTVSIHWYTGSWLSPSQKLRVNLGRILRRILGEDFVKKLKR